MAGMATELIHQVATVSSWTTMKSPVAETLRPLKGIISEIVPNRNSKFTCAHFSRRVLFPKKTSYPF
jgi:hypothetical protein